MNEVLQFSESVKTPSLRSRLLLGLGLTFVVTTLMLAVGVWAYAQRAADLSYDRLLTGAGLSMLDGVQVNEGQIDIDLPNSSLEMLAMAPSDRVFYRIQGPDGEVLTGYSDLPSIDLSAAQAGPRFFDARYKGGLVRFAVLSKKFSEPELTGRAFVTVGHTRLAREELAREILLGAMGLLGLTVTVALVGLGVAISRAFAPLNSVRQTLAARAASDLTPIDELAPREIEPLVQAINGFMLRLKDSMDTLQMFIARAAHQIRTPLSNLKAQIDLSEKDQGEQALRIRLARIKDQHDRLTRLTNQLLSHALVVHRADSRKNQSFDLTALLEQIVTDTVRDHADSALEFGLNNEAGRVEIQGDPISLREALSNLIHNSIKYGPPDNEIVLGMKHVDLGVELSVSDRGPGIAGEDRSVLLKRFERRQQGVEEGTGLGLAIVQEVVQAHGGHVEFAQGLNAGYAEEKAMGPQAAQSPEAGQGGLTVRLWLPLKAGADT